MNAQTQSASDIRDLDMAEIDNVAGGPIPLVLAIIAAAPVVITTAYALGEVVGSALAHSEIAEGA